MSVQKQENKKNSSELIQREQIEETPFILIKTEDTPWFLTIGKYKIANEINLTKEQLIQLVNEKPWNLITIAIEAIIEHETKHLQKMYDELEKYKHIYNQEYKTQKTNL